MTLPLSDVRAEIDELGNAFVWCADSEMPLGQRLAGIWHRDCGGELVDNHVDGSEEWTAEVAAAALAGPS